MKGIGRLVIILGAALFIGFISDAPSYMIPVYIFLMCIIWEPGND